MVLKKLLHLIAAFLFYSMKTSFSTLPILLFALSLVILSCKKEDDTISDTSQDDNQNNPQEYVFGCMVDTACNYNSLANQYGEKCDYSCYGCTDETAYNYDSENTIDDGSCVYANQLITNTWNVDSECDGLILGNIIPKEITIESGVEGGEIIADFGIFILNGTIDQDGFINIPPQDVSFLDFSLVTVSGNGQLQDEQNATINITATVLVLSESCTLTFSLL